MTETSDNTHVTPAGHALTIIAGLVVLVCLVGSATALAFAGWDGNAILGLLAGIAGVAAPLLAAVAKLTDLKHATDAQTQTLAKIDHQTNGILDTRIHAAVHKALNEPIGYVPTAPTDPPAPQP